MSTAERINQVVARQLGVNASLIKPEDSFVDDLGADSIDEIELVMAIEDEFEIEISDDDAEGVRTVQQAYDYIAKRVPA